MLMKKLQLLLFLILLSCGQKYTSENGKFLTSAIIDGAQVTLDDYASLSVIGLRDQTTKCSGTLISENLIVTAAHCVSTWQDKKSFGKAKRKLITTPIMFYSYRKEVRPTYVRMDQIELFPTEDFDDETNHDFAIVKLKEKAPKGFKAASLLSPDYIIQRNSELLLAGFGYTDRFNNDNNMELPRAPYQIKVPFVEIRGTRIVVSQVNGKRGAYFGDSGGPAYIETENGLLLAGSTQSGSAELDNEAYYINLGSFKDFILKTAKKMNAIPPTFKTPDQM